MYLVVRAPEFGVTIIITIVIIIVSRGEKLVTRENKNGWKTDRTQTKITTYMRGHCAKIKQNTNRRTDIYPMLMNKIEKKKAKAKNDANAKNRQPPKTFFLSCFVFIKFRVSRK